MPFSLLYLRQNLFVLTDGTITLEPISAADAADMATLADNAGISKNMRDAFPYPYTVNDAVAFIKSQQGQNPPHTFGIHYNGRFIGATGLFRQPDVYRFSAELGYWIGEPYWGKGLTTRAVKLITAYGFETMELCRIYADVYESNPASMRVLEKCGFTCEGILKKSVFKRGAFLNSHRYAAVK